MPTLHHVCSECACTNSRPTLSQDLMANGDSLAPSPRMLTLHHACYDVPARTAGPCKAKIKWLTAIRWPRMPTLHHACSKCACMNSRPTLRLTATDDAFYLIGFLCFNVWNTTEKRKWGHFIFSFLESLAGLIRLTRMFRPWKSFFSCITCLDFKGL
jgi:hypothetical protein